VPAPAVSRGVIVDDWPMLRVGVAKVLEDLGVRVVAATEDGATALSAIRTHQADLLIIGDHANPSPELIQRAFSLFPELRCVVMVAGVGPAGLRRLFDVGIHAMVSRSVDPTELGDVVRRVLAGERVVSPGLLPAVFGTPGQAPAPTAETDAEGETEGAGAVPPFSAPPLTPKEREVLRLVSAGRTNAEIAAALFVSGATVKTHLAHIYEKLGVRGRYEALSRAVAWGLLG
jgi:DNA-binding NarL/FixJ family response regulator